MRVVEGMRTWWQLRSGTVDTPFDGDTAAFLASLTVHIGILVALGSAPLLVEDEPVSLMLSAPVEREEEEEEELVPPEEFFVADRPMPEIGANSAEDAGMSLAAAEVLSEISDIPSPVDITPVDRAEIEVNMAVEIATGPLVDTNVRVRGAVGEGTTGAAGAVDRITQDILLSLEERRTLVVWLFDQSGSLARQRSAINERFDRIYEELGVIEAAGNEAFKKYTDKPLLTSVVAFGKSINFMTEKPTDKLEEIQDAVNKIKQDDSGVEHVFSAVFACADKFAKFRRRAPRRNVMLIVFTDEAGEDQTGLDRTVDYCRRLEMPVYVVGVPAPFGRAETMVKWVDPDPKFDQSPQWAVVNQGPESLFPERVKLRFSDGQSPDPMDSGFGPFALTRLAYETGGIYFTVHPNRNVSRQVGRRETAAFSSHLKYFFDPVVMRKYRPDYVSAREYQRRVNSNKSRMALLSAARMSWTETMETPNLRFVKRDEATFSTALSEAQKVAAKLEPQISRLYMTLKLGESDREKEASPRWQAGYDLAMGRVMAAKVRTESYNAMLAAAKRGMKFKNERNNTWQLNPNNEITVGSQLAKQAKAAQEYLQGVVDEHDGTPWALLAQRELKTPMGWQWVEQFTNLAPPPRVAAAGNNNNTPRPARNETKRMLKKPPPRRPPPKL